MAVIDVGIDHIGCDIPNTTEEFTRTPKMAFTKMFTQPRMLAEKLVRASAFKQLKRSGNTHDWRQVNKDMDMVGLNLKLMDFNAVILRNFTQKLFTMVANNRKLKRVSGILGLPHKVKRVLTDAVVMVFKSFHFGFLRAFFYGAHATQGIEFECASYAAHSFHYKDVRNSLRRYRLPLG